MTLDMLHGCLSVLSGMLVGFTLGMFGGGGSILAAPCMVYMAGVQNFHTAIGTSAFVVAVNAAVGLFHQARHGMVKWKSASIFGAAGTVGALAGSMLGKQVDGHRLLHLFAVLMLAVAVLTNQAWGRTKSDGAEPPSGRLPKIVAFGAATGSLAGFFGIGGGFLIVPGLIVSTGMPLINAISSSLVAVLAFSFTTTVNYAAAGMVSWAAAAFFVTGGLVGVPAGCLSARRLAHSKETLKHLLTSAIAAAAVFIIFQ